MLRDIPRKRHIENLFKLYRRKDSRESDPICSRKFGEKRTHHGDQFILWRFSHYVPQRQNSWSRDCQAAPRFHKPSCSSSRDTRHSVQYIPHDHESLKYIPFLSYSSYNPRNHQATLTLETRWCKHTRWVIFPFPISRHHRGALPDALLMMPAGTFWRYFLPSQQCLLLMFVELLKTPRRLNEHHLRCMFC